MTTPKQKYEKSYILFKKFDFLPRFFEKIIVKKNDCMI